MILKGMPGIPKLGGTFGITLNRYTPCLCNRCIGAPDTGELAFKEKKVKVTMALSQASVDFFKAEAKKHHTSYQAMIHQLLDIYASQQRS